MPDHAVPFQRATRGLVAIPPAEKKSPTKRQGSIGRDGEVLDLAIGARTERHGGKKSHPHCDVGSGDRVPAWENPPATTSRRGERCNAVRIPHDRGIDVTVDTPGIPSPGSHCGWHWACGNQRDTEKRKRLAEMSPADTALFS